ncbi:MAG TPA: VOC family protein [Steroidobacteraceae bacterium]|nr:VOC family protein [Steroidobacteraceae bacterium]
MKYPSIIASAALIAFPTWLPAAPGSDPSAQPHIEHIAVWVKDVDRTARFLSETLGWRRHPLVFGVNDDDKIFGGMNLAFVDANGLWLELVQPTTPGPGMDFLKEKGDGALVELDFFVDDFDKAEAAIRAKGIKPVGMDGKPLVNGGRLTEWAIEGGKRVPGEERLLYLPMDVSGGTSVEIGWEYPSGVVLYRDATWTDTQRTPRSGPRVDHTVVLAADLEKSAKFYTGVLGLPRIPDKRGVRHDWMSVGDATQAWFKGNGKGFGIQVVAAPATAAGSALIKNPKYGDGAIMELDVEVEDIDAFFDQMKVKGITMTAGDGSALHGGQKAVIEDSGVRYSYFPEQKSEGMRIMVYQQAAKK